MLAIACSNEDANSRISLFEDQLFARLMLRTGGRLRSLRVGMVGTQLCVWGAAPTYHVRQLAEQAALSVIPADRLQLEIEVVPALQWHERAMAEDAFASQGHYIGMSDEFSD